MQDYWDDIYNGSITFSYSITSMDDYGDYYMFPNK